MGAVTGPRPWKISGFVGAKWGAAPYDTQTPLAVIEDYVNVRGDLVDGPGRQSLATWIERYARAREDRMPKIDTFVDALLKDIEHLDEVGNTPVWRLSDEDTEFFVDHPLSKALEQVPPGLRADIFHGIRTWLSEGEK